VGEADFVVRAMRFWDRAFGDEVDAPRPEGDAARV
jgi:hypothetical protein